MKKNGIIVLRKNVIEYNFFSWGKLSWKKMDLPTEHIYFHFLLTIQIHSLSYTSKRIFHALSEYSITRNRQHIYFV